MKIETCMQNTITTFFFNDEISSEGVVVEPQIGWAIEASEDGKFIRCYQVPDSKEFKHKWISPHNAA